MIDKLIELDREAFLFFNGSYLPWLDPIMLFITSTIVWIPLYLILVYLIIKEYKKEAWTIFLAIAITILLSDQITSSLMKPYFARLRPSQDPALEGLVHIVQGYKGGKFGFASSHAANTFGLATFFWLALGGKRKWIAFLFLWAAVVTYTRVYLGVHYPGDIIIGALIGILCGIAGFRISGWLARRFESKRMAA
jgi:undecaprenyl-diphosphatase